MVIGMLMETCYCLNIQCDKIRIAQQNSTRRTYLGSRQNDKATGYYKTWTYLARRMVKNVEQLSAQIHKYKVRRKAQIGRSGRPTRHLLFPDDERDHEENHEQCKQQIGEKRLGDASESHQTRTVQAGSDPMEVQNWNEKIEIFMVQLVDAPVPQLVGEIMGGVSDQVPEAHLGAYRQGAHLGADRRTDRRCSLA